MNAPNKTRPPQVSRLIAAALIAGPAFAIAQPASTAAPAASQPDPAQVLSFFITSEGSGKGANLGGIDGADAHCQKLASAVGAGRRTWHAYLSTQAIDGKPAVNARDRIGTGPWLNARGVVVARDVAHLHGDTVELGRIGNNLNWATALTERGDNVKRSGDKPNQHDILTGSQADGRAFVDAADHTCRNYTSGAEDGSAQLGHFDRTGGNSISWNAAHASRGCSQEKLVATGGAGLFYCFAVD